MFIKLFFIIAPRQRIFFLYLGYSKAYLSTHDQQVFYSCCGYKFRKVDKIFVSYVMVISGRVSEPICFGAAPAPAPEDIAFLHIF